MFARARRHTIVHPALHSQRGVILLLIVLSMLAIVGVVFLGALSQSATTRRDYTLCLTQLRPA